MERLEPRLKAYKAVANKTRLRILLVADENSEGVSFGELRKTLRLNSNALDFHLGRLTDAKLIANKLKTPVTKRSQADSTSGVSTLSMSGCKTQPADTHYSYYQITDSGREILERIGIKQVFSKPSEKVEKT